MHMRNISVTFVKLGLGLGRYARQVFIAIDVSSGDQCAILELRNIWRGSYR